MYFVNSRRLTADGTDSPAANRNKAITALTMDLGVITYSEAIKVDKNVGFFSLLVKEDKAGGAGDCDIFLQYSNNGTDWAKAYTTSGAALTLESNVVDALQNVTRWIVLTARLAKFVRVAFDPDANCQITADFTFQEDQ